MPTIYLIFLLFICGCNSRGIPEPKIEKMIPKRNGRQLPNVFITTQDMGPPLGVTDANNESA